MHVTNQRLHNRILSIDCKKINFVSTEKIEALFFFSLNSLCEFFPKTGITRIHNQTLTTLGILKFHKPTGWQVRLADVFYIHANKVVTVRSH